MGGACCAGTRDKITYGRERGSEMCGIMQENVNDSLYINNLRSLRCKMQGWAFLVPRKEQRKDLMSPSSRQGVKYINQLYIQVKFMKKISKSVLINLISYSQIYCDVVDDSDFGFLTRFEADNYQICKVTMDSFERILKEFQEKEETNIMSKHQIVEAFKNRKYLIEIENEYSLSYVLLTHPLFQKDPDSIYIQNPKTPEVV